MVVQLDIRSSEGSGAFGPRPCMFVVGCNRGRGCLSGSV